MQSLYINSMKSKNSKTKNQLTNTTKTSTSYQNNTNNLPFLKLLTFNKTNHLINMINNTKLYKIKPLIPINNQIIKTNTMKRNNKCIPKFISIGP